APHRGVVGRARGEAAARTGAAARAGGGDPPQVSAPPRADVSRGHGALRVAVLPRAPAVLSAAGGDHARGDRAGVRLSVVIPTRDRRERLARVLDALAAQAAEVGG